MKSKKAWFGLVVSIAGMVAMTMLVAIISGTFKTSEQSVEAAHIVAEASLTSYTVAEPIVSDVTEEVTNTVVTTSVLESEVEESTEQQEVSKQEESVTTTEQVVSTQVEDETTTELVVTTQIPDETTTVEWYVSDYNNFAVAVDKDGNVLNTVPDCEPAGVLDEVEVGTATEEKIAVQEEPEYGSDEFLLAYAMSREAKHGDYTDATYVGNVILNRVDDPEFPNSVLEVLQQYGQYPWGTSSWYSRDYIYDSYFYEIARNLLNGNRPLPQTVVYQAQFKQGSGVYCQWGVHYYCYK